MAKKNNTALIIGAIVVVFCCCISVIAMISGGVIYSNLDDDKKDKTGSKNGKGSPSSSTTTGGKNGSTTANGGTTTTTTTTTNPPTSTKKATGTSTKSPEITRSPAEIRANNEKIQKELDERDPLKLYTPKSDWNRIYVFTIRIGDNGNAHADMWIRLVGFNDQMTDWISWDDAAEDVQILSGNETEKGSAVVKDVGLIKEIQIKTDATNDYFNLDEIRVESIIRQKANPSHADILSAKWVEMNDKFPKQTFNTKSWGFDL